VISSGVTRQPQALCCPRKYVCIYVCVLSLFSLDQ